MQKLEWHIKNCSCKVSTFLPYTMLISIQKLRILLMSYGYHFVWSVCFWPSLFRPSSCLWILALSDCSRNGGFGGSQLQRHSLAGVMWGAEGHCRSINVFLCFHWSRILSHRRMFTHVWQVPKSTWEWLMGTQALGSCLRDKQSDVCCPPCSRYQEIPGSGHLLCHSLHMLKWKWSQQLWMFEQCEYIINATNYKQMKCRISNNAD